MQLHENSTRNAGRGVGARAASHSHGNARESGGADESGPRWVTSTRRPHRGTRAQGGRGSARDPPICATGGPPSTEASVSVKRRVLAAGRVEGPPDSSCDGTLEAADDFSSGLAFRESTCTTRAAASRWSRVTATMSSPMGRPAYVTPPRAAAPQCAQQVPTLRTDGRSSGSLDSMSSTPSHVAFNSRFDRPSGPVVLVVLDGVGVGRHDHIRRGAVWLRTPRRSGVGGRRAVPDPASARDGGRAPVRCRHGQLRGRSQHPRRRPDLRPGRQAGRQRPGVGQHLDVEGLARRHRRRANRHVAPRGPAVRRQRAFEHHASRRARWTVPSRNKSGGSGSTCCSTGAMSLTAAPRSM